MFVIMLDYSRIPRDVIDRSSLNAFEITPMYRNFISMCTIDDRKKVSITYLIISKGQKVTTFKNYLKFVDMSY